MVQFFINYCKQFLSKPGFYHYSRQILLLGMPLRKWAELGNYYKPGERIADLGCGPSDILRFLRKGQLPEFYLGIDISDVYMDRAKQRTTKMGLNAQFITLDLTSLIGSTTINAELIKVLNDNKITTVNMFGILHHIDNRSALYILNTIYQCHSVRSLTTQDVLVLDGNIINNFYVSLDRGNHVRSESEFDALMNQSDWQNIEKCWSKAGVSKVKYIHYRLKK